MEVGVKKEFVGVERNNRTMGKHHTRVKMLASSKCSVCGWGVRA